MKETAKAFGHEDKKEGGEWISLTNATGGAKGGGGGTIDKDGEAGRGNKIHEPAGPSCMKTKCQQHLINIRPT